MDALEMSLLYDYYGGMLTDKQRQCFDMRYNQDLSLGEIAQVLDVSRQAVCDNLNRTEALLRKMEANIGYVTKDIQLRRMLRAVEEHATVLISHSDSQVRQIARHILSCTGEMKE